MNVFFTCKNTLVILLQLYRLYVVNSEHRKNRQKDDFQLTNISIISKPDIYSKRKANIKYSEKLNKNQKIRKLPDDSCSEDSYEEYYEEKNRLIYH